MNKDEELYLRRIAVCRKCKLLKIDPIFKEMCNSTLYLNPSIDEISPLPKPGYLHGCGCVLGSKCRVIDEKCPLGKW